MNRKRSFGLNIGTSSILVILVVVCLVCFACLSLVSANADYRLSRKLADRTDAYYEAVSDANRELARLTEEITALDEDGNYRNVFTAPVSFSCPISEEQSLIMTLQPVYPSASSDPSEDSAADAASRTPHFRITRFQVVTEEELQLDESLPVFLGN